MRVKILLVLGLVVLGCRPLPALSRTAPAWRYEARVDPVLTSLAVEAWLAPTPDRELTLAAKTLRYVEDLEVEAPFGWARLQRRGAGWSVPASFPPRPSFWHLRYRFRLGQAGRELKSPRLVATYPGAVASGPDAWLVRPSSVPRTGKFTCHMTLPSQVEFLEGIPTTDGHFEARCDQLEGAPGCILGGFSQQRLAGGRLTLAYLPGQLRVDDSALIQWARDTANGVANFYGQFPCNGTLLLVLPGGRRLSGYTYGSGGATATLVVPRTMEGSAVLADWTLCHELVHVGIPNLEFTPPSLKGTLTRSHHWLEEGVATYVEPLIRLGLGEIDQDHVWRDLVDGLPQGLPEPGDSGLDHSSSWGSTYWGGALFCLLADIDIRVASDNRRGLRDALRGVVAAGGNVSQDWTIERVLDTADRAVAGDWLERRYRAMGLTRASVDLSALWAKLGIASCGGALKLFEAPLAYVRRGITSQAP